MTADIALAGFYDYRLVALSAALSVLAAYAALDLAELVRTTRARSQLVWLCGGAMGCGIWAMNSVGLGAFHLPVRVAYDWPTLLLSLVIAVVASSFALLIVSFPIERLAHMQLLRTFAGSIFLGLAVESVHGMGMAAMRLPARFIHSHGMVTLSALLAVATSFIALQLMFSPRQGSTRWSWRKLGSGLVIGLAIPITHYADVATMRVLPAPLQTGDLTDAVRISYFALATISIATLIVLAQVYAISTIDRNFSQQSRQLAENKRQLQAIFDNLTEWITVLDRDRGAVQMNDAMLRRIGHTTPEMPLRQFTQAVDVFLPNGEMLAMDQRPAMRALRGDFVHGFEVIIRRRDTGQRWTCEVNSAPIADDKGKMAQVLVSYRDITERKQMDEARTRLVAIVESSEDAIIGKDTSGIVTSWNKGAEKIFGYTAEEMVGQPLTLLLPSDRLEEENGILALIQRGEFVDHIETVRKKKDGRLIQILLSVSPIRNAANEIVGASKIARDITNTKMLERQLRQSQKMEAIGQLTGGIAHDFNNLLAIVIGNLGLLERMVGGDQAALTRVQTALRAAERGGSLTRRLLAFSSKETLNPTAVVLEELIQNVIALADRALGPEIRIATRFDRSVPAVYADAAGLESALLNLVVNARDAMPKGGTLTIHTQASNLEDNYPPVKAGDLKNGRYACVTVTDSGTGMSPETLERAFEPFFTTKPRNKGTGLGLAMVYGFAKQSGGTARIYSELGFGTSVSLYFPIVSDSAQPAPESAATLPEVRQGGKILVVDDEPDLLEIASAHLSDMGYEVLEAADSAEALKAFARFDDIDLMITDVIMPGGMNGAELAQAVRQLSPRTKVIFSSGFPAEALAERSGTLVDGPVLHKPYQRSELAAIVLRTMEQTAPPGTNAPPPTPLHDAEELSVNRGIRETR
jgi:PAS domain S-box-containing protein